MRTLCKCVIPILIAVFGTGCASSGKKTPPVDTAEQQKTRVAEILEQVDRNAATIRENQNELSGIAKRLADLESKINTTLTENEANTQEIKENLAFMNDQILRLDTSVRTRRPVTRPSAANVFKPGGFDAKASYKGALNEYYSRRYESAISGFYELLTVAPNNDLADNAQYWIGECYYAISNFEKALEAFGKVFDFPESNKLSDAQLKIGLTYLKLGDTNSAREELKAAVQNYPGTSGAKIAAQELRKLGE